MRWVRRPRQEPPAESVSEDGPAAVPLPPPQPFRPVTPGRMRRERRALAQRREIEIRDVGGLAVEMVRRDRFRPDLLVSRAGDVLAIEQRLHELDSLLFTSVAARELRGAPPCECGAPLLPGAHFCSHCGRPALATPPVVTCGHCGRPVPADANFCASCGNSVADQFEPAQAEYEETMVRRWSPGEDRAEES